MADISEKWEKVDQESGIAVDIIWPGDGLPIGMTWWVAGPDSKRQKAARHAIGNARLRQMRSGNQTVTQEMLDTENRRVISRSVVRWEYRDGPDGTKCSFKGEQPECSAESALKLLETFPWMYEQVNAEAGSRAGFMST